MEVETTIGTAAVETKPAVVTETVVETPHITEATALPPSPVTPVTPQPAPWAWKESIKEIESSFRPYAQFVFEVASVATVVAFVLIFPKVAIVVGLAVAILSGIIVNKGEKND